MAVTDEDQAAAQAALTLAHGADDARQQQSRELLDGMTPVDGGNLPAGGHG